MELINSVEELLHNLAYLDAARLSEKSSVRAKYFDLVKRGTTFVVYPGTGGGQFFAPSRFIGYRNNSFAQHDENESKHGTDTNNRIKKLLGHAPQKDARLDENYKGFCQSLGFVPSDKGSFGNTRRYWKLGVAATIAARGEDLSSVVVEGKKKRVYSTRYERHALLRKQAIKLHGTTCFICEIKLSDLYGSVANGFIHIHHRKPLSETGETRVDPRTDLIPLCPTCHAIVHRNGKLLSVNEVRRLLGKKRISLGD